MSPIAKARALRKRQTPAEEVFWELVRNRRLNGLRVRRQYIIAHEGERTANRVYIVDFYISAVRLCIEIDGSIHAVEAQADYDAARKLSLRELGYRVIRFTNEEVLHHIEDVIERLQAAVREAREILEDECARDADTESEAM